MPARRPVEFETRLDWTKAKVGEPKPCVHYGRPALLRHPQTDRPAHKVCDDAQYPVTPGS